MRLIPVLAILFLASPLLADEPKANKGLPYAEPKNERQMLDVYAPTKGENLPVVLWIHGGGWRAGDKANVLKKPQVFVDKGYVFVATNHRFFPNVTVKEMTGDIAKAIRWIHDHAKDYGGDPKSIFVMGHSSGAHLAALVCTDDRYLNAEGLPLSIIKGCVPVDVSVYDIPKRLKDGGSVATATFTKTFGEKEESQRDYSPAWHVVKGKSIPPFLILHVADRAETKVQAHWLAEKLKNAGIPAKVVAAEGTTHGTINSNLGSPGDRPTQEMWAFLTGAQKKEPPKEEAQAASRRRWAGPTRTCTGSRSKVKNTATRISCSMMLSRWSLRIRPASRSAKPCPRAENGSSLSTSTTLGTAGTMTCCLKAASRPSGANAIRSALRAHAIVHQRT